LSKKLATRVLLLKIFWGFLAILRTPLVYIRWEDTCH
jgi:hypothetical protein